MKKRLRTSLRPTLEVQQRVDTLLSEYPELYENESHVFRCAIMRLYATEIDENGRRKRPITLEAD